jgi:hypothetical protein
MYVDNFKYQTQGYGFQVDAIGITGAQASFKPDLPVNSVMAWLAIFFKRGI